MTTKKKTSSFKGRPRARSLHKQDDSLFLNRNSLIACAQFPVPLCREFARKMLISRTLQPHSPQD
jgi:hypothetical protein